MITVQLGQCGQQLGCSFFQSLAAEFAAQDYGSSGLEQWFRPAIAAGHGLSSPAIRKAPSSSSSSQLARAVLIDMEPKVVGAVKHAARASGTWSYPPKSSLCMDSGAGNNWANGYHGYGPSVRDTALELIRREVEACDVLNGFLLLQSMAGGTGAGLGTYIATALRDEYPVTHALNCCVWPYESGEVIVQSYNTLFTLSHLHDVSDGIITLENDALHRVCTRLMNIPRPSFEDMNTVAAQSLSSVMLPSCVRPPSPSTGSNTAPPPAPPAKHTHADSRVAGAGAAFGRRPDRPTHASSARGPGYAHTGGGSSGAQRRVHLLPDVVAHLCCHPMYRMLSLRSLPQVPVGSIDFTTFTWPAITKRLRQMVITGSAMEEGLDWGVTTQSTSNSPSTATHAHVSPRMQSSPGSGGAQPTRSAHSSPSAAPSFLTQRAVNKSLSSWLVLRGQGSGTVDVSSLFADPGMYPWWAVDPLLVSHHPAHFARCAMSAAALSNDQSCMPPMERMLDRAYGMLASRAYVHQYEKYGMAFPDFQECFAQVEEIAERYRLL